jgi:hypothetical protein
MSNDIEIQGSRLVEKLRKKEDYMHPFIGFNFAVEQFIAPRNEAIITLSELNDKEIRNMTMISALNLLFKKELGTKDRTVMDVLRDEYLLLRMARGRRRIKELIRLMKTGGRMHGSIVLKPIKRMLSVSE